MASGGSGPSRMPPGPPPGGPTSRAPPGPPPGGPGGAAVGQYGIPLQGYPGVTMPMQFPPAAMPNFAPPLPPGWSEHRAPDGVTPYFYNSQTKESTYVRPTAVAAAAPVTAAVPEKKKKKEKAKNKVPIPDTEWTRVTTNEGNVFYFHKETKRSEWTVPEEIAEAVAAFEAEEKREKEEQEKEERLERLREQERVRAEVEAERKRKADLAAERKRKAAEEADAPGAKVARKEEKDEDDEQYAPKGDGDDEEWMKAVAAEFAESDANAAAVAAKEEQDAKDAEEAAAKKVFAAPSKVNVSPEEGRALFKALLIEKDISPFAPWDQSLPLFINDPRYVLLPSMKERQNVYEEYCRDAGRARRLKKEPAAASSTEKKADPEREYRAMLRDEVTSTRTRWDDFRRKWKKDKRFYSFGRDDREREKMFKTHLRELGERKRADAQRAEIDFFELLKEIDVLPGSAWVQIKKTISHDPRYDAVGSSSLREELFNNHLKKLASGGSKHETAEEAAERKLRERKEKQQASLRERESKVRVQQQQVTEDVTKSRAGAGREEGERLFGSLLVDVVRDYDMSWPDAQQILQQDKRFNHPSLRPGDKQRLFEGHVGRLGAKKSNALHSLFAANAPALDTPFDTVYNAIADDPLVARLSLTIDTLEERFNAWHRARDDQARREFSELLGENSFVEFWGRMRKKTLDEAASKIKEHDERDEGEGIGEGGAADITALAKQIDLNEIKVVLRRDKRYRQFDHIPEMREKWLRDYLENMKGSEGSETIHQVGGY